VDPVDFPLEAYEHFMCEEGIVLLESGMDLKDARLAARNELEEKVSKRCVARQSSMATHL
jgi:hypothetical protein